MPPTAPQEQRVKLVVPLTVTKALDEQGTFEGYGSTFDNVDLGNDVIRAGAFTETLQEWSSKGQLPAMLWAHNMNLLVGDWLTMREDERGLAVTGKLWVDEEQGVVPEAIRARRMMKGTGPKGLSIGFSIPEGGQKQVEIERDGRKSFVREITKANLFEVSVVPFGMNPEAVITNAKHSDGRLTKRQLEAVLRDAGCSRNEAQTLLAKGYDGLRDAAGISEEVRQLEEQKAQEQEEVNALKAIRLLLATI